MPAKLNANFQQGICLGCGIHENYCPGMANPESPPKTRCCSVCLHPLRCDCPASVGGWCCVGRPAPETLAKMSEVPAAIRADPEAEKAHDANRREPVAPKDPAPQGADLTDSLALAGAYARAGGAPLPHPEACRGLFPRPGCGLCDWLVSKGLKVLE